MSILGTLSFLVIFYMALKFILAFINSIPPCTTGILSPVNQQKYKVTDYTLFQARKKWEQNIFTMFPWFMTGSVHWLILPPNHSSEQ
jgi:hypothetical protein